MGLTVENISQDEIKPSIPTPPDLRIYKLSVMDQVCPSVYVPTLLYYRTTPTAWLQTSDRLKKSLSAALTHMYPLAGRAKDDMSIECNDQGAIYIEARITQELSAVLDSPKLDSMLQLFPCRPLRTPWLTSDQPLLAVQVNHFGCGGMAIGVCIRHEIADASAIVSFLQKWVSMFREVPGENKLDGDGGFICPERTLIFPPRDNLDGFRLENWKGEPQVSKLLVFDAGKVAVLKEKAASTRVKAVMAFIWGGLITAAQERNKEMETHMLTSTVNVRKRMNPPLPTNSLGAILHIMVSTWEAWEVKVDHGELASKLTDSINMVTDEFVKEAYGTDDYIDFFKAMADYMTVSNEPESFAATSWCRFPFYEIDFGWGKPVWVSSIVRSNNMVILMDSSDGEGIEAWVRFRQEDMERLEQNEDFLAFISAIHDL